MKWIICALVFGTLSTFAQSDVFDSTEYVFGLPVTDDDTVTTPIPDAPPRNIVDSLSEDQIPKRLLKALDSDELYRGWRKRGVFRDRNSGLYVVFVPYKSAVRRYRLNERGKTVTYNEYAPPRDSLK